MKRVWIAIVVVVVALAGVVGWQVMKPSDEPVYRGRALTSWLRDSAEVFYVVDHPGLDMFQRYDLISPLGTNASAGLNATAPQAREALHQIGTNAIPTLLRLLRAKDSPSKAKFINLARRQRLIKIELAPSDFWNYAAAWAFQQLGESARSAVPSLIDIAKENVSQSSRKFAIMSLGSVGPAAKEAVPALLLWLTNADSEVRSWAAISLRHIDPQAAFKAGLTVFP